MVTPEAGRSATALSSERPTSSWARLTHRIARSAPTACAAATIPSRTRWGFRVSSTRSLVLTGSPSDPLATTTGRRRPEPAGRRTAAILRAVGKPAPPLPRNPARRPRTRGRPGKERAPSGARGRRTRCRPAPTEAGATRAGGTRRRRRRRSRERSAGHRSGWSSDAGPGHLAGGLGHLAGGLGQRTGGRRLDPTTGPQTPPTGRAHQGDAGHDDAQPPGSAGVGPRTQRVQD